MEDNKNNTQSENNSSKVEKLNLTSITEQVDNELVDKIMEQILKIK